MTLHSSIICIGNRFTAGDAAGLAVFDQLKMMQPVAQGVEIVEGGLAGLNLLPYMEKGGRVVFVDAVSGYGQSGEIVLLDCRQIASDAADLGHFGHNAGLAYLLAILPKVCEGEMPSEIIILGLEGDCTADTIRRAADLSITLAQHGLKDIQ